MKKFRLDTLCFQIGKVIWLPVILAGSWFVKSGYSRYGEFLSCAFYRVCKFPCSGCGGTRAVYYLFQGKWLQSFLHHPAILYLIAAYVHFMLLYVFRRYVCRQTPDREVQVAYYGYGMIAVILLQWSVKLLYHFN